MTTKRRIVLLWLAFACVSTSPLLAQTPASPLPPGRVEIDVEDLHCKTCAKKVARKLYGVRGVKNVKSDLQKDRIVVTLTSGHTPVPAALWNAVAAGEQKPVRLRHADKSLNAEAMAPLLAAAKAAKVN